MNKTLAQINNWILKAKEQGYGEMEFKIMIHNYYAKWIEMKAGKGKKGEPDSVTKRVMVKEKK